MIDFRRIAFLALSMLVFGIAHDHPASADPAKLELGKKVFSELAEPKCGLCHSLADAGANGGIGPSLDGLKPDAERVKAAVVNGIGIMPAFESLTETQVDAVAFYVSNVAGQTK